MHLQRRGKRIGPARRRGEYLDRRGAFRVVFDKTGTLTNGVAATMLSFGMGTVPAVLAAGLLGGHVWRAAMARGLNLAAGSLLLVFGFWTMLGPLSLHAHD